MKRIKRGAILLAALLFFSTSALGQGISEQLCNQIFDSVAQSLKPIKVYRKDIYNVDCEFEFTAISKSNILISIKKHRTEEESSTSMKEYLDPSTNFHVPKRLKTNKYWDSAFIYESNGKSESFILLRKQKFEISIFSIEPKVLIHLEKLLHNVEFRD